jgi:hypothetical protein
VGRIVAVLKGPPAIEVVPVTELDILFNETFGTALALHGFVSVDRRRWVRSVNAPIRELVIIHELKGGLHTPCWGLSLDFVPHLERGAVRWHSTPGSARLDLRYDPIDYTTDPHAWGISTIHGMATAREQALTVSAATTRGALRWFAQAVAPNGLLALFEAQRALPAVRLGFENYPQQILALAFVLAREGSLQAARQTLERALDLGVATDAAADELRRLIDNTARADDSGAPAT